MTHDPIDFQAAISEAAKRISAEVAAAVDMYVLEQGPLRLERDDRGYKFVARQEVRLRLKEVEEIRAEERERIIERIAMGEIVPYHCVDCMEPNEVREAFASALGGG